MPFWLIFLLFISWVVHVIRKRIILQQKQPNRIDAIRLYTNNLGTLSSLSLSRFWLLYLYYVSYSSGDNNKCISWNMSAGDLVINLAKFFNMKIYNYFNSTSYTWITLLQDSGYMKADIGLCHNYDSTIRNKMLVYTH